MIKMNQAIHHTQLHSEIAGKKFYLVRAASTRFLRFMPYMEAAFPATAGRKGIIESDMVEASDEDILRIPAGFRCAGMLLKKDSDLPITGHVEDRGGVYAVLKIAEDLAVKAQLVEPTESRIVFDSPKFHDFFAGYTLYVGQNLNLSDACEQNLQRCVSVLGEKLGFRVGDESSVAPEDLSIEESATKQKNLSVDASMEEDIFMGYAVAALRAKVQLAKLGRCVDESHPLFVYLPCENDLAAGGIAFGLKQVLGDMVHCFLVGEKDCFSPYVEAMMQEVIAGQIGRCDDFMESFEGEIYRREAGLEGKEAQINHLWWEM